MAYLKWIMEHDDVTVNMGRVGDELSIIMSHVAYHTKVTIPEEQLKGVDIDQITAILDVMYEHLFKEVKAKWVS